ncbi:hypothetical protein elemo115C_phanotate89 [Flavobacterium phage vB_FspP_elemoA_11-5C]|jgi:hypothetical protein|nr:hypothetical protein elemo115C_phanotate89 [Flavobacterium phage vB_FspP_elemoA_11-5C]
MAVVGKVGTYAQVQPIQGPDFGGMVKGEFDKLDAEKKAKAAAKAKADKDKEDALNKLSLPEMEMLNINGLQDQRYNWYKSKVAEFRTLKEANDYNGAQRLMNALESEANAVKQTNDKLNKIFANRGIYDDTYLKKAEDLVDNIDKANVDVVDKGDGELRYNVYKDAAKTELMYEAITPYEYVTKLEVPLKFDSNKEADSFADTFRLDEIEKEIDTKSKLGTVKTEDLLNNERVLNRIDAKANEFINDDRAMAHFGKTIDKFETRANAFDEDEKKQAKEYFSSLLKDAYKRKIDLSISQKSGGGGGKDGLAVGTPTLWESGSINLEKPETLPGRQPVKTTSLTTGNTKSMTIASPTGKTLLVGSMPLDRVIYDAGTGRMYIGLSYNESGGQSMSSDGSGARESVSNKLTKWYPQDSAEFNAFKTVYNSAFKTNLQTIEDFKNTLFIDRGL